MKTVCNEDLLYLQQDEPLILPFELLPKDKVAKDLQLVLRVGNTPYRKHSQQL